MASTLSASLRRLPAAVAQCRLPTRPLSTAGDALSQSIIETTSAAMLPNTAALASGLLSGDRSSLARSITLIESTRPDHRRQAELLLDHVLATRRKAEKDRGSNATPSTFRVGLAGPPGAGKSTLIEALGSHVLGLSHQAHRVAVVAVDPSSTRYGGSILGDKTRMEQLSRDPRAFVRPSPTRGALGGIARDTADVVLLCEGGGYDTVLVETVGLGQSEVAVESVVDMLLLVVPPGGGDELQGVKKGIVEVADAIVVNKADGDLATPARHAAAEYRRALQLVRPKHEGWQVPVLQVSAATGLGVSGLWDTCTSFRSTLGQAGTLASRRREQASQWMWQDFERALVAEAKGSSPVLEAAGSMMSQLQEGRLTPRRAAQVLIQTYHGMVAKQVAAATHRAE